jgi:PadR family transcriptional regulator PadR
MVAIAVVDPIPIATVRTPSWEGPFDPSTLVGLGSCARGGGRSCRYGGSAPLHARMRPLLLLSSIYKPVIMSRTDALGEFEQLVLLAVAHLGNDAYGVRIRGEIESRTGRSVSVGALYTGLKRLEQKGYLESAASDPLPQRGGRSRRHYELTAAGTAALRRSHDVLARMWTGLESRLLRRRP